MIWLCTRMRVGRTRADMEARNRSPTVGRARDYSTHASSWAISYYCGPSGCRGKRAYEFLAFSASGPYVQPRQFKWMACSRQLVVPFHVIARCPCP